MKQLIIVFVCLLWTNCKLYSQGYFPVPNNLVPTAQDFIRVATEAIMRSGGNSVNIQNNTSTEGTTQNNRSNNGNSQSGRSCPVCLGDGKCYNIKATASTFNYYCHGNKICRNCSGKGIVISPYTGTYINCSNCWVKEKGKCGTCQGTGNCSTCHGTGKI